MTKPRRKISRKRATPKNWLPLSRLKKLETLLSAPRPDQSAEFDFDHAICQTVWPEAVDRGLEVLSPEVRRYYGCFMLEGEVNNGGFLQFFDNGGPELAKEALAFLQERGPRPVTALLQRAIKAFPGGRLPRSRERLQDITLADHKPD